jgi:tRNA uridine 5-carboxymethylaminomethyl modification enzyme
MGCLTALVTLRREGIGQMSCNPAIGGLGKGQLVKEVDALGGIMGRATDLTGIQFRILNESKGPAVRSSRAQADRERYRQVVRQLLEATPNLTVVEGEAEKIISESGKIKALELINGDTLYCSAMVVTTGTFLRGLMHTGVEQTQGGRKGDRAAHALSDSLRKLGFDLGRLKTGTPARLKRSTIDLTKCLEQAGDLIPQPFSIMSDTIRQPQVSCWITTTNQEVHDLIRANRERSPMFNGQIKSGGPRYCPSIEDKVFRFADKLQHQIFLEPEGYVSDIVYPNGISTSLPSDVQDRFIRMIPALEQVEILCYGYAVEYDFVDPRELAPSLETKKLPGLFLAGQINGTSGYEEAAGQGIIAGINAALKTKGLSPFIPSRGEAYLGVMIDDLTTNGVDEPYRMFTSRAEYRLVLREDNAPERLSPHAMRLGLLSDQQKERFLERQAALLSGRAHLEKMRFKPNNCEINKWLETLGSATLKDSINAASLLKRPQIKLEELLLVTKDDQLSQELSKFSLDLLKLLETEAKFAGYLKQQEEEVAKLKRSEGQLIPDSFSYDNIPSLRTEAREKLKKHRPTSLGHAMRIPGITPSTVSLLSIFIKKHFCSSCTTLSEENEEIR